jgi:undecaprenyl-diphosphatase
LLAGSAALGLADRVSERRGHADARPADAWCLGLAQACALIPGVSRNGATLAAARLRGFRRPDAARLSWEAGLPVIAAAAALKGARLRTRRPPPRAAGGMIAGALAAAASTAAVARVLEPRGRLAPFAVYRCALAALTLWRLRRRPPHPRQSAA